MQKNAPIILNHVLFCHSCPACTCVRFLHARFYSTVDIRGYKIRLVVLKVLISCFVMSAVNNPPENKKNALQDSKVTDSEGHYASSDDTVILTDSEADTSSISLYLSSHESEEEPENLVQLNKVSSSNTA